MKSPIGSAEATQVAQGLLKWITTQSPRSPARRGGRIQIVSPSLCHDTLQRLSPSLKPYHGCDLIDINPGTCLWSRHIHDVIKPRRHILIEPARKAFDQYITPLIKEDPDCFAHATELTEVLDASGGFLSENILKGQTSDALTTNNRQLLITANLTGPVRSKVFQGTLASFFLKEYYKSFWAFNSEIHRYGLVRLLAWVPDSDRSLVVPRSVDHRRTQNIILETTSSVSEIAGTGWSQAPDRADDEFVWPGLVQEGAKAVRAREVAANVKSITGREDVQPSPLHWSLRPDPDILRELPIASSIPTLRELSQVDDQVKRESPEWRAEALRVTLSDAAPSKLSQIPDVKTPAQRVWRDLMHRRRTLYRKFITTAKVVKNQRDLEQRWRHLLRAGDKIDDVTLAKFDKEAQLLQKTFRGFQDASQVVGQRAMSDYRAFDARPQSLAWNQRPFEPLKVRDDEFAPCTPLSLVDLQPTPEFRQTLLTQEQCQIFEYVVSQLCWTNDTRQNVHEALTALLQAGVDEFVETCPSLKDPMQGGWYDLTKLRVRGLSPKLFLDIALAWEKWPFKPDVTQTILGRQAASRFEADP